MDPWHFTKITNNSSTSYGSYIKSTTRMKMQQVLCHYILQIQEHFQKQYSIKQTYIQSNKKH